MLEVLAVAAGVAAGGTYVYLLTRRGKAHARWKVLLDEVAKKLGGRASPGSMFDAPELRATLEGVTVTLKLREIHKPEKGVAIAEAKLANVVETLRIYVGWDVAAAPVGLEHVPDADYSGAAFVEGKVVVRGSDAAIARRFVELAALELVDLRRESSSRAMEVIVRGGHLELLAHGMQESAPMVERLAIVSARLAGLVARAAEKGEEAKAVLPDGETLKCTLCLDVYKPGEKWSRCSRCRAPYHQTCWAQATGCVVDACGETQAKALE